MEQKVNNKKLSKNFKRYESKLFAVKVLDVDGLPPSLELW
jgi:hypothetical protein